MTSRTVKVKNTLGTREAALFVQTASKFKSNVKIALEDKLVNAKSLMCLISLGLTGGMQVTIQAEGEDEVQAAEEVSTVLLS